MFRVTNASGRTAIFRFLAAFSLTGITVIVALEDTGWWLTWFIAVIVVAKFGLHFAKCVFVTRRSAEAVRMTNFVSCAAIFGTSRDTNTAVDVTNWSSRRAVCICRAVVHTNTHGAWYFVI